MPNHFTPRIGFEAEIMFGASEYPELVVAAEERDFPWEDDCEAPLFMRRIIADDLGAHVGSRVHAVSGKKRVPEKRWAIKPEYDVEHAAYNGVACAVEVITPPLPVDDAKNALMKLLEFFQRNGGVSDTNTGLHVSIDAPDSWGFFAPVWLSLSIDEEAILKRFKRDGHALLVPQRHRLIVEAAAALLDGNAHAIDHDFFLDRLGRDKHFGINFGKLDTFGFVEFRHCGGPRYFARGKAILATVDAYLRAMTEATTVRARNDVPRRLQREIETVLDVAQRITLVPKPVRVLGIAAYNVLLDDRPISEVIQLSSPSFKVFPLGQFDRCTTELHVDGLTKAKALAAFEYIRSAVSGGRRQYAG